MYGNGSQTRSFYYVDDLIEGFIRLMATTKDVTGPINLGNPNEFSMLQLANIIIEITGSSSEIVFKPLPLDDPKQRQPDTTLAKKVLDWKTNVPLKDGIIKTIEYFDGLPKELYMYR
jgi:UDP-glucuronate decarboxylase